MALPRELVAAMQAGLPATDEAGSASNLAAAAEVVSDFATDSAAGSLDRLLMLCEDAGDARAAAGLAAEARDRAELLEGEVRRFLRTAARL